MNRIILIGNGFDLAQDLKTSYKHFIDDLWDKKSIEILEMHRKNRILHASTVPLGNYEDNDIVVELKNKTFILQDNIESGVTGFNRFDFIVSQLKDFQGISNITFKNKFLSQITFNQQLQNWVDIEEEYYKALKNCFENRNGIIELNNDFQIYYKIDDNSDNYTDLSINISRNFKDKSLFRERVVNYLDCEQLI